MGSHPGVWAGRATRRVMGSGGSMYLRPVDSRTCTFRIIGDGDGGRARASAWRWSQVLAMLTRGAAAPRKAFYAGLRRAFTSVALPWRPSRWSGLECGA